MAASARAEWAEWAAVDVAVDVAADTVEWAVVWADATNQPLNLIAKAEKAMTIK